MNIERPTSTYYFENGLADIEVPRYAAYVKSNDGETLEIGELNTLAPNSLHIVMRMNQDSVFIERLYQENIISPADQDYDEWKGLRSEFEYRKSCIVSHRFGLILKQIQPVNFLIYMFLHRGIGHLVGNMVFLWIVGNAI